MPEPVPGRPGPIVALALCLAATLIEPAGATTPTTGAAPAPAGVWMWDDGRAAVKFHACANALCGRIVWLKQEWEPGAGPVLDIRNADPGLRRRRICGLDYIWGLRPTRNGVWKGGRVYDFNGGAVYDLDIDSVGGQKITMRGYKGIRLLGADLTLLRQSADLPPCPGLAAPTPAEAPR